MSSSAPARVMEFAHVSPATRLLDKRRQMFEVQEALVAQQEEYARREDALRRREDALRRRDVELQESLVRFNRFLQENESKKTRALRRAADERRLCELKDADIADLRTRMKDMVEEEAGLAEQVRAHLKYKAYLDSAAGSMTKFSSEIADILNRYSTLREVNRQLIAAQQTAERRKEDKQRELLVAGKEGANALLSSNNAISALKEVLEVEHSRAAYLQGSLDRAAQESSAKALQLGQILAGVANVLARCEESFRLRHGKPARVIGRGEGLSAQEQCRTALGQLDELALFLVDFKSLVRDEQHARAANG